MILGVDLPIDLRKEDRLLAFARNRAEFRDEIVQSRRVVGLRDRWSHAKIPCQRCKVGCRGSGEERLGARRRCRTWKVSVITIEREEEEQSVLDNRSADAQTVDFSLVGRLDGRRREGAR